LTRQTPDAGSFTSKPGGVPFNGCVAVRAKSLVAANTPSTFDRTGLSPFDRAQNSTFESYTTTMPKKLSKKLAPDAQAGETDA
jgi:hypothetical protein